MTEILRVDGVSRTFSRRGQRIVALDEVSLSAGPGEVIGLLGVNGAGKSTLLKIISTLLLPTRGRVRVAGYDTAASPRRAQSRMSVVLGGDRGFYNRVSARDNAHYFATLSGLRRGEARALADAALERFGLAGVADRAVETYSKGMLQRLHLAVGMITRPALMLLDEPTVGLDALEADRLRGHIAAMSGEGTTVLLTSHYLADIERLAGRVLVLQSGRLTHDMPLVRLLASVPAATEVTVVLGREPAGPAPAGVPGLRRVSTRRSADGGWKVTYHVDAWNDAVLRALADEWAGGGLAGVQVSSAGLEQVFAQLSRAHAEEEVRAGTQGP